MVYLFMVYIIRYRPRNVNMLEIHCHLKCTPTPTKLSTKCTFTRAAAGASVSRAPLADPYPHAHLHLKDDLTVPGASGICIDSGDRLYAATEPGIQTTSQQGENNTILPLPGNPAVVSVAFGGDGMLYARSEDGKIWRRPVLTKAPDGTVQPPDTPPF